MNRDGSSGPKHTRRVDWISWCLHLVFGFVAGLGVGFICARLLLRSGFIGVNQMLYVVAGVACCCGSFTSYRGDSAWLRPLYASMSPPPGRKARTWSLLIAGIGAALILLALVLRIIVAGWPAGSGS